ncbi:MAG: OmpA family protein [Oscillospiraceae bacterium]|nr:OmpA family protein [Oscillospiraceae bacterium]
MARGRGREEEQDEGSSEGGWLTTYADMVTLLLTFFVLLFAISNVDAMKFQLLAAGLSRDGISAEQFLEIQLEYDMAGVGEPDPDDIEYPAIDDDESILAAMSTALDDVYEKIQDWIFENELQGSISIEHKGDFLLLTLSNDIWFVSGSAEVSAAMREKGSAIARMIAENFEANYPFEIQVEGHTDNVPINTARYPSNWDLSADRALNFLRILMNESGLNPGIFSIRAYGEEAPIATNDTTEGKQMNRRVEVNISQPRGKQPHVGLGLDNNVDESNAESGADESGTDDSAPEEG